MPGFVLIDGYNLLHATGILARGIGPGTLERARLALLGFLAASLDPEQLARTTVVFDAADHPPGSPREVEHRGLKVLFAAGYADADTLIEQLIRRHSAPRQLTVVSSDRRIQQAARRRRARAVDSDVWYAELLAHRQSAPADVPEPSPRPPVPLLEEDVEYWLRQFGGEPAIEAWLEAELDRQSASSGERPSDREPPIDDAPGRGKRDRSDLCEAPGGPSRQIGPVPFSPDKPTGAEADALANPFPEGYGEDLLDEDL